MNVRVFAGLVALMLATVKAPVMAHVTIAPRELRGGSIDEIRFRCPDERANSATTKLVIQMPQDYPLPSVKVLPIPGWHSSVTMRKLDAPIKTERGDIVSAVDTITWEGGTIEPGQHQDFAILAGPIPTAARQLVFKALQTYDNGEIVRWIETRAPGEPEPPNPAPAVYVR